LVRTLILLITLLSFGGSVNIVKAKTYIVNFDYIGGVEVKTDSPFPPAPKAMTYTGTNNPIGSTTGYTYVDQTYIDNIEAQDDTSETLSYSRHTDSELFSSCRADAYVSHRYMFSVAKSATITLNVYIPSITNGGGDNGLEAYIYITDSGNNILDGPYSINVGSQTSIPVSTSYVSSNGELYVTIVAHSWDTADWNVYCSTTAEVSVSVDYIEVVAEVPDSSVQSACLNKESSRLRDWDGIFDDDTFSVIFRVTESSGTPIANYPGFIRLTWDSGRSDFAANWSDSYGYLTLSGKPIHGSLSDKWRVDFTGVIKDVMINGVAYRYDSSCSDPIAAENVAITPGSYDITLVGRYWDAGGGDWVRIRWIAEQEDVSHVTIGGYDIP